LRGRHLWRYRANHCPLLRQLSCVGIAYLLSFRYCNINFIAGLMITHNLVISQALDFKMWRFEVRVRHNQHSGTGYLFDFCQRRALFIEQVSCNINGHDCSDLRAAILCGFLFHQAKDRQGQ